MPNRIRYAILDHAGDDAPLWELTWGLSVGEGRKLVEVHPPMTVAEARPWLDELLRDGHVKMYDWDAPDDSQPLDLEAALSIINDDANWEPRESRDRVAYSVQTTESGEEEYKKEHAAHASEG
jgi:hypothetical protein